MALHPRTRDHSPLNGGQGEARSRLRVETRKATQAYGPQESTSSPGQLRQRNHRHEMMAACSICQVRRQDDMARHGTKIAPSNDFAGVHKSATVCDTATTTLETSHCRTHKTARSLRSNTFCAPNQVSVVWRDAYTAAVLLCVCIPPEAPNARIAACASASGTIPASVTQPESSATAAQSAAVPANGAATTACSESSAPAEALRQLDMAALLGGPLFRPTLDACTSALQVLMISGMCCRGDPAE